MQRWKASLGLNAGEPIADPNDPRKCIIKSLALQVEGRPDVIIDLSTPGSAEKLKDSPFRIKEGSKFHIKATFQVHHEVLSGLKYLQVVKRSGIRVSKDEEMLGSYAPNTNVTPIYEKICELPVLILFCLRAVLMHYYPVAEEEAPSGMLARAHYNAVSKFIDDDDHEHLKFDWSFDIAKDW
jgi:Rho GDP-dissociation inhibitor